MILQIIIEAAQVLVGFLLTRGVDDEIPAKTRETLEKLDRVLWRLLVHLLADGHPDISCASEFGALADADVSAVVQRAAYGHYIYMYLSICI